MLPLSDHVVVRAPKVWTEAANRIAVVHNWGMDDVGTKSRRKGRLDNISSVQVEAGQALIEQQPGFASDDDEKLIDAHNGDRFGKCSAQLTIQ